MSRSLLAFLGVSDYLPCNYELYGKKVDNVRFVQEALASMLCEDWNEDDRIIIFLTKEAKNRNWVDNGHIKSGKPLPREGLERRLKSLNLKAKIIPVDVPEGKTENELWEIFDIILQQINEEDEVIFDITHAYRSLPLLVIILLNYARVLKHIEIKGIYYGAFEVLGSRPEVSEMNIKDRNAPIFDLTPFAYLFDWTSAINNFITYGDARSIFELTDKQLAPIFREAKRKDDNAIQLKNLGSQLKKFTELILTTRGYDIVRGTSRGFNVDELKKLIKINKGSMLKPINPLLDRISSKVENFHKDDIQNGYRAVEWCIEHGLIQQGITLLQETMISEIVVKHFGWDKINDREKRELVVDAINTKIKKLSKSKEGESDKARNNKKDIEKIMEELDDDFLRIYDSISQHRNDINHAGFKNNPHNPENLKKKLRENFEKLER